MWANGGRALPMSLSASRGAVSVMGPFWRGDAASSSAWAEINCSHPSSSQESGSLSSLDRTQKAIIKAGDHIFWATDGIALIPLDGTLVFGQAKSGRKTTY